MNNSNNRPGIYFNRRAFTYGLTIGLAVGLATKNWGVGMGLGLAFAAIFGAFRRSAKCENESCDEHQSK